MYWFITGGSDGIGRETALELAGRGARVIIASRRQSKGEAAVKSITGMICANDVTSLVKTALSTLLVCSALKNGKIRTVI